MVTAPELLAELDRVLRYPKLQRYYRESERRRSVALIMALSDVVELPAAIPRICRDADDDRVIACAVSGEATVIVSGDRDLLALERVGRISILPAVGFQEVLVREALRLYIGLGRGRQVPGASPRVRQAVMVQDKLAKMAPGTDQDSTTDIRQWREARG
jgi:putative PIN family toxin of toxin-antitoxin system